MQIERGTADDRLTLMVHSDRAGNEAFIVLFYTSPLVPVVQGRFAYHLFPYPPHTPACGTVPNGHHSAI